LGYRGYCVAREGGIGFVHHEYSIDCHNPFTTM
jgi:IMP dehydrogenase/GMP reductase